MARRNSYNDKVRALWISNDEGLYRWWLVTGKSKAQFIRTNREKIDEVIHNILSGKKQSHYLFYEGGASS